LRLATCKIFNIYRYIKVDTGGYNVMLAKQLFYLEEKPQFVSGYK